MRITSWMFRERGAPMDPETRSQDPGPGEVVVEVAGCGVCHTDLAFAHEGVPTRLPPPVALGHEISGRVVEAGRGAGEWVGRAVIVPAVLPCGSCAACAAGRGSICPAQVFPGNDVHGGFGSHVVVPARGLCPVPDLSRRDALPEGLDLVALSVIADAVSTPFQAILRSGLEPGDLAIVVGVGGVGGFGAQIAAARGASVVAVDVDGDRLAVMERHGVALGLRADRLSAKDLRGAVRAFADDRGIPGWRRRIFECSGTRAGQETAFGLLAHGAYLSVVGFTPEAVSIRLSNLMAFDARAEGNWGCLPEHYPAVLDLVLSGRVAVEPFIERRPLRDINAIFEEIRARRGGRRIVLVPEGAATQDSGDARRLP